MSTSPTATPATPHAPAEFLFQMATGYMVSSALYVVTKLEVADQLAKGPRAIGEIDLEMLLMAGGRERTADEFRALFGQAGFELTRIVANKSPLSAVEARVKA